jgi:hypothetical protein
MPGDSSSAKVQNSIHVVPYLQARKRPPASQTKGLAAPVDRRERQRRAQSWNSEIVRAFKGAPVSKSAKHLRFADGWTVRIVDGAWYCFQPPAGGHYSTVELVHRLQGGSRYAAAEYVAAWLRSHEGHGPCNGVVDEDDDGQNTDSNDPDVARSLYEANRLWELRQPIAGTIGYTWLEKIRQLPGDYSIDQVAFLPLHVTRPGDYAVLFPLYCFDRRIGFELNLIDPVTGDRPLTRIRRKTFYTERGFKGPVTFAPWTPSSIKSAESIKICEGWPDQRSLQIAYPRSLVLGTPGAHWWTHLQFPKDDTIVLCRDGDAKDSDAYKKFLAAVDHFILADNKVLATDPDDGKDSNDYLREHGRAGLKALVDGAAPRIALSMEGEIVRLSRIHDPVQLDIEIEKVRKKFPDEKPRISSIRTKVEATRRVEASRSASPVVDDSAVKWEGPVDIIKALEDATAIVAKWTKATDCLIRLSCLWVVTAHMHRNPLIDFSVATNLKIQANQEDSGKTTWMQMLGHLCPPGTADVLTHYTAADLRRRFLEAAQRGEPKPGLLLDELQHRMNGDLVEFIAGCSRKGTRADLLNPGADGRGWERAQVDQFGPLLLAGIHADPDEVVSRCIVLPIVQADESALERQEAPTVADHAMLLVRAHMAAWAAAQSGGPIVYPERPEWIPSRPTRRARHWLLMLEVANRVGGGWPAYVEAAARLLLERPQKYTMPQRFLISLLRAFNDTKRVGGDINADEYEVGKEPVEHRGRMLKRTLLALLKQDAEEDWRHANNGREITHPWLNDKLIDWFDGLRAETVTTGGEHDRRHHRVYVLDQFRPHIARLLTASILLSESLFLPPPAGGDTGGTAGPDEEIDEKNRSISDSAFDSTAVARENTDDTAAGSPVLRSADGAAHKPRSKAQNKGNGSSGLDDPGSAVSAVSSSADQVEKEESEGFAATVRVLHAANPEKSIQWLARKAKQPQARVRQALGLQPNVERPSKDAAP